MAEVIINKSFMLRYFIYSAILNQFFGQYIHLIAVLRNASAGRSAASTTMSLTEHFVLSAGHKSVREKHVRVSRTAAGTSTSQCDHREARLDS